MGIRKTVWRWIRTISVAISATLMVLLLGVMVWSFYRDAVLRVMWFGRAEQKMQRMQIQLVFASGKSAAGFSRFVVNDHDSLPLPYVEWNFTEPFHRNYQGEGLSGRLGFGGEVLILPFGDLTVWEVFVPTLLPIVLFSIWPTIALRRWWINRHRRLAGLCLTCGYDLRSSVDRCPECGRAIL